MNRYFLTPNDKQKQNKEKSLSYRSNVQFRNMNKSLSLVARQKSLSFLNKKQDIEQITLPSLKLKKVLGKIGASIKQQFSYIPPQAEQKKFRNKKMQQLKDLYPFATKKRSDQPFKFQLDQIVLDCYNHGQNFGRKTIWRNYRKNIDSLSFDTMKVLHKK